MSIASVSEKLPRVLGILIARNEWPLLGISITHALVNHVDELIVVDHASTDETQAGLAALQTRWGNKIQVLHMCEGTFHHEETNLMLKAMYQDRDFDWVYPIDADEFLITRNNISLKQILAEVTGEFLAARFQLHNFVVPHDFDETDFSRYREINQKALVNPQFELTHENIYATIMNGNLNFFDVPFDSKVMSRPSNNLWAAAGSHSHLGIDHDKEYEFSDDALFVAHLPFLTRERLMLRVAQGRDVARSGYSRDYAWQSQVVYQMDIEGRLDEYWKRNSIPIAASDAGLNTPKTVTDNRLAPLLELAIAELLPTLDAIQKPDSNGQPQCESSVTISQGINAIRVMALLKQTGTDNVNKHLSQSLNEVNALTNQANDLRSEGAKAVAENTFLLSENCRLRQELSIILDSSSWRWTRSLRYIHHLGKAAMKFFSR